MQNSVERPYKISQLISQITWKLNLRSSQQNQTWADCNIYRIYLSICSKKIISLIYIAEICTYVSTNCNHQLVERLGLQEFCSHQQSKLSGWKRLGLNCEYNNWKPLRLVL